MTLRPADANEVVEAWRVIMQLRHEPVALVLTRQPLPTFDRSKVALAAGVARGVNVLAIPPVAFHRSCFSPPVAKCRSAWARWIYLARDGVRARVVSMPSWELLKSSHRTIVRKCSQRHGTCVRRAGRRSGGAARRPQRYCLGMKTLALRRLQQLQQKFGFTAERVAAAASSGAGGDPGKVVPPTDARRRGSDCHGTRRCSNQQPATALNVLGQSIWLDSISRHLLDSGELKQLIANDGLRGVTSNPAIFEHAIRGSADYAATPRRWSRVATRRKNALRTVGDPGCAGRHGCHAPGAGRQRSDGYVSLEVSRTRAQDRSDRARARDWGPLIGPTS